MFFVKDGLTKPSFFPYFIIPGQQVSQVLNCYAIIFEFLSKFKLTVGRHEQYHLAIVSQFWICYFCNWLELWWHLPQQSAWQSTILIILVQAIGIGKYVLECIFCHFKWVILPDDRNPNVSEDFHLPIACFFVTVPINSEFQVLPVLLAMFYSPF